MGKTYRDAGVDIDAADRSLRNIKSLIRSTFTPGVLTDIGLFGGFFEADFSGYSEPVLVSSVDGVGTKLNVAVRAGKHDTVGSDLVNHCVNDIAVSGAVPLFFMDYFAAGKLSQSVFEEVMAGFVTACKENGCALIGGETAEMPGMYRDEDYDLAGMIVGVVDKPFIINGSGIKSGDSIIGLRSNGLHTNGYSLARSILFDKFEIDTHIDELGCTIGEELLKIHRSYLSIIRKLIESSSPAGFAHITGGGIEANTMRILPEGKSLDIQWTSWEVPPVFRLIQQIGGVSDEEMRRVFNMGIGLVVVANEADWEDITRTASENGEEPVIIGKII